MRDVLGFLEAMLNSWPLALVIIVIVLRRPLSRVLRSIRELTANFGGTEIHIMLARIDKLRESEASRKGARGASPTLSAGTPPSAPTPTDIANEFTDQALHMLTRDPAAVIAWAWAQLSLWIASAASRFTSASSARTTVDDLDTLLQSQVIDQATYEVLLGLQGVRNRVVHGAKDVTTKDAITFIRIAQQMIQVLAVIASDPGGGA